MSSIAATGAKPSSTKTRIYEAFIRVLAEGHLYQTKFKSFPIQSEEHFYVVCRYVERNPVGAKLVGSAKLWRFGSLYRWNQPSDRAINSANRTRAAFPFGS